jgi:glutamyl-tRNA(Gln) amidotransferase subunit D
MPKPGDTVKVNTSEGTYQGVLMPNQETDSVVIKLPSGYNMGFSKAKPELVSAAKKTQPLDHPVKRNPKLPTIAVLHTGGTIASKVDYETGGVYASFSPSDLVSMVPEITKIANIETELVANMMSEDMDFEKHQLIAKAVEKHAKTGVKGIIIGHGTDTLSYTAAMLSFMFEKINIPVMLVGSQRSSDRGSSDAFLNLLCAARFIVQTDYAGIATCLHHASGDGACAIIQGTKVRKMHTSRRDAFRAINDKPIALVHGSKIEYLKEYPKAADSVLLKPQLEDSVGLLKSHPNLSADLVRFYTENFKGFVVEGTGLGHAPTNLGDRNLKIFEILKSYIAKGGIVAMTSQCINGRVHPSVYSNLRRLSNIGVVYCEDILPETAFCKLAWLLGNCSPDEAKKLLAKDLRGEINPRLELGPLEF